jgi:hypothetical protein
MATSLDQSVSIGNVGGYTRAVHAEFTGGSTSITVAANTSVQPASVGGMVEIQGCGRGAGGTGWVVGMKLYTNKVSITPRFRVHLTNSNSITLASSGSAWVEKYADAGSWNAYDLAAMSSPSDATTSDCSRVVDYAVNLKYQCGRGSTSLYYALEPLDAYTCAANQKYDLYLLLSQD